MFSRRRERREWQRQITDEIARLTAELPEEVSLVIPGVEDIMTEKLRFAQAELKKQGYRLRSARQVASPPWIADFERER